MSDHEGPNPAYRDNPLLMLAFRDMILWASQDQETLNRFRADTGFVTPANGGAAAMIDEASGYSERWAEAFTDWCIVNLWGEEGDDGR